MYFFITLSNIPTFTTFCNCSVVGYGKCHKISNTKVANAEMADTNSVDPDKTAQFDQDLHCLPLH